MIPANSMTTNTCPNCHKRYGWHTEEITPPCPNCGWTIPTTEAARVKELEDKLIQEMLEVTREDMLTTKYKRRSDGRPRNNYLFNTNE